MQKRVRKVLIVCSPYEAFMLEEDGRVEERVYNEYASLHLSSPPQFSYAHSAQEAFGILNREDISLVIEMLSMAGNEPFHLAKQIKALHPSVPIVVLTRFNRDVSLKLQNEDLSAIDYVFCWLGNHELLVAIIKLVEDALNVRHDVLKVGVQALILIEDSIRYTSVYLPALYKTVLEQSREIMQEGLNEHQKLMRMRGRPKVLLANNYHAAMQLYNQYKENILGIISDVSYKKNAKPTRHNRQGRHSTVQKSKKRRSVPSVYFSVV
ncbi:MAG: response regulator [Bacteroidales bacterium]|nr:response regulator [Bacteroidales bacterium]